MEPPSPLPPPHLGLKLIYGSSNFANNPFNILNIQLQSEVWAPTGEIKISRAADSGKYNFIPPPPNHFLKKVFNCIVFSFVPHNLDLMILKTY